MNTLTPAPAPSWLKKRVLPETAALETRKVLKGCGAGTVCESALCPNSNECFAAGQATFMILGKSCSRSCGFCSVDKSEPAGLIDREEPARVAKAAKELGLKYVVITSVTRDDLPDGGAAQFALTAAELRKDSAGVRIEFLVPDFGGSLESLKKVLAARPDVLGHNIETVGRLYPKARRGADYRRSLKLLKSASVEAPQVITKSGMMLGLGEAQEEVFEALKDLRAAGCSVVTLGQYLRPSAANLPVERFVRPEEFKLYEDFGRGAGFKYVASGPFVRSSYRAEEIFSAVSRKL